MAVYQRRAIFTDKRQVNPKQLAKILNLRLGFAGRRDQADASGQKRNDRVLDFVKTEIGLAKQCAIKVADKNDTHVCLKL